jgi:predicted site-specific integrase-resolvase
MFRALSLIIQITYLEFKQKEQITILIDDIGEGLDFERANNLIKYLIKIAEKQKNNIQLIMTTNDRLVMNSVALEYWIILGKDNQGNIDFYNYSNNKITFDKFKRIGLSNFDFFTSKYYKQG